MLRSGDAGLDEARSALAALEGGWDAAKTGALDIVVVRKMGVAVAMLVGSGAELVVEDAAKVVARIELAGAIEELKTRLR